LGERVPVGGGVDGRGREGARRVNNLSKPILPSVPQALKALARLESDVERAETFIEVDDTVRKAEAYRRAFKGVPEVANRAGLISTLAERKVREKYDELPKATGTRMAGKDSFGSPKLEPPNDAATQAELGLEKKRAARGKKLVEITVDKIKAIAAGLAEAGRAVSPSAILAAQRAENKRNKVHAAATAVFSEEGPFDVVVIDPLWPIQKIDRDENPPIGASNRSIENHYPTLSLDEICALKVSELAAEAPCSTFGLRRAYPATSPQERARSLT
jgi:hypothetical protein